MDATESFHKKETLALVGRYATPLAAILTLLGLFFAPLAREARHIGYSLFVFALVFNLFFVPFSSRLSDHARSLLAKSRATINLWINIVLVVLLGRVWPPIWLLLTLSSVGTAIYGTRERTLVTGLFLSFVLVAINLFLGLTAPLDWGLVLSKSSFIVFMGLMINDLSRAKKENP